MGHPRYSDLKIQQVVQVVREHDFIVTDDLVTQGHEDSLKVDALGLYEVYDTEGREIIRCVVGLFANAYNTTRPIYLTDKEYPRLSGRAFGPVFYVGNDPDISLTRYNQKQGPVKHRTLTLLITN